MNTRKKATVQGIIGILVPMGASATGVSFGLGSGEGVVKALFILCTIIIGFVLMIRSLFRVRNDTLRQDKKEEVNDRNKSKTDDDNV